MLNVDAGFIFASGMTPPPFSIDCLIRFKTTPVSCLRSTLGGPSLMLNTQWVDGE